MHVFYLDGSTNWKDDSMKIPGCTSLSFLFSLTLGHLNCYANSQLGNRDKRIPPVSWMFDPINLLLWENDPIILASMHIRQWALINIKMVYLSISIYISDLTFVVNIVSHLQNVSLCMQKFQNKRGLAIHNTPGPKHFRQGILKQHNDSIS